MPKHCLTDTVFLISVTLHSLLTACHMGVVVLTLFLLFDISVAKEFLICYYYWFNGPRKQWLRNLHTVRKYRLALLYPNTKVSVTLYDGLTVWT